MGKKIKLKKQLRDSLYEKRRKGIGVSKHSLKNEHNSTPYIHADATYQTYLKQCIYFAEWVVSNYGQKDMGEAFNYVAMYLQECEARGQSAWTIQTKMNAIAKAYGISTEKIPYTAPKRHRSDVKRSRGLVARDNLDLSKEEVQLQLALGRGFGFRRGELENFHWEDLIFTDKKIYAKIERHNGQIAAKGGRKRIIEGFLEPEERKIIEKSYKYANGIGKAVARVNSHLDEHASRADYACRCYKAYARDIKKISKEDKYICRKDKAGIIYDKKALAVCSKNLGHNRICVVSESYLHNL